MEIVIKRKENPAITKRVANLSALNFKTQFELQSMVLPSIVFLVIFAYIPMCFVLIAFKNYNLVVGFLESPWSGFKYFAQLFTDSSFGVVLRNTFGINLLGLVIGFPAPIILALLLDELTSDKFKKFVQTSTYVPYFFSWAVYGGMVLNFLSPSTGLLNNLLLKTGLIHEPNNFIGKPNYFWMIIVLSGVIKGIGYSAILYIAAIASIDQELFESAKIDGSKRLQSIWYITIPCISGTIVILLIFTIAGILNTGMEQILVLQNIMNLSTSETLDTYVYKVGLVQMSFSYATAVGLFKSVVALVLLGLANSLSKKLTEKGLF